MFQNRKEGRVRARAALAKTEVRVWKETLHGLPVWIGVQKVDN